MIRWALVPIAAVAVWYAALITGILGVSVLDLLCPPEQMVSDLCVAPWYGRAVDGLIAVMAALAAFGIVLAASLVAPAHRVAVSLITYLAGAACATWFNQDGQATGPFVGAALGGITAVLLIKRGPVKRSTRRAPIL